MDLNPNKLTPFSVTGTELEVCKDIAARQQHGLKKYGLTVAENPLKIEQWAQHAYEESLDFPIYLKRLIGEALAMRVRLEKLQSDDAEAREALLAAGFPVLSESQAPADGIREMRKVIEKATAEHTILRRLQVVMDTYPKATDEPLEVQLVSIMQRAEVAEGHSRERECLIEALKRGIRNVGEQLHEISSYAENEKTMAIAHGLYDAINTMLACTPAEAGAELEKAVIAAAEAFDQQSPMLRPRVAAVVDFMRSAVQERDALRARVTELERKHEDDMSNVIAERDGAEDVINELCEAIGWKPEWTSAYCFNDAIAEAQERVGALVKQAWQTEATNFHLIALGTEMRGFVDVESGHSEVNDAASKAIAAWDKLSSENGSAPVHPDTTRLAALEAEIREARRAWIGDDFGHLPLKEAIGAMREFFETRAERLDGALRDDKINWGIMARTLRDAQREMESTGIRFSWMDAPRGIAEELANRDAVSFADMLAPSLTWQAQRHITELRRIAGLPTDQLASSDQCAAVAAAMDALKDAMEADWDAAVNPHSPSPVSFDLVAHLRRQWAFSERTFGPGRRTAGNLAHIRKELDEIEAKPDDLVEWMDVALLAFDGALRHGGTPESIVVTLAEKLARNETRTWPDWRTVAENEAITHVKE